MKVEAENGAITSKLDARSFAPPLRVSTPISRVIDRRLYHAAASKAELPKISFSKSKKYKLKIKEIHATRS